MTNSTTTTKTTTAASLLAEAEADLSRMVEEHGDWVTCVSVRGLMIRFDGGLYLGQHQTEGGKMAPRSRKDGYRFTRKETEGIAKHFSERGVKVDVVSPIVGLEMDIKAQEEVIEILKNLIANG